MYQGKVNYSQEEGENSGPDHKNCYVQVSFTGLKWKLKVGRACTIIGAKFNTCILVSQSRLHAVRNYEKISFKKSLLPFVPGFIVVPFFKNLVINMQRI